MTRRWTPPALAALFLWICTAVAAPSPPATVPTPVASEAGTPLLRSFVPADYAADGQNWALVQGHDGVIHVGNNRGVLSYDGQRWRLTPVANRSAVRSLAVDAEGRVYVGAVGELGYLEPAADGQMQYVSLLDRVPAVVRDFADVWGTVVTPEGVVFSTRQRLLRWRQGHFSHWDASERFGVVFGGEQGAFVVAAGQGLLQLQGERWVLLPAGERFSNPSRLGMVALPGGSAASPALLIYSPDHGFVRYAEGRITPWPADAEAALLADGVQGKSLQRLADGRLLVGTLQGGLYVLDADGRLQLRLGKAEGLPDASVAATAVDRDGGAWLALGNGLARLSLSQPLSRLDARHGLASTVIAMHRHQGEMLVATTQGAYRLLPGAQPRLQALPGIDKQTWAFLSAGQDLLVASVHGVHAYSGERSELILDAYDGRALLAPRTRPGWVVVGLAEGLSLLHSDGGRWRVAGSVPGLKDVVRTLVEDRDGMLWVGTYNSGIVRVDLAGLGADGRVGALPFTRFDQAQGLPGSNYNLVFTIGGEPAFATSAGIYRFESAAGRFVPDPRFAGLFAQPRAVYVLQDDPATGLWAYSEDPDTGRKEAGLIRADGRGGYRWDARMLRTFSGQETFSIHAEGDGVVWFGVADGLFRYDARQAVDYEQPFATLLRRVSDASGRVRYGGHGPATAIALPYADNALRFEYAAPSFEGEDAVRFQVKLEGSDADWSDWSDEDYKDYNHLSEGEYVFRVRARNLYDSVGSEARYAFRVLPPWYRTPWAYLGYALLLVALGWIALRWRLRRLLAQKAALEATVAERTRQIAALGEIGRAVTAQLDLDSALDTLRARLGQLLTADALRIGLYHPETGEIEIRLAELDGVRRPSGTRRSVADDPLSARCLEQRRPLLIEDVATTGVAHEPDLPPTGTRLYVPLLLQDRVLGVLVVAARTAQAYGANERDLLLTLAAYAATAIDNARSHQQLGQQASALREANTQLIALDGFKRGMMAMIVHDLKNPLNIILNAVDSPSLLSRLAQLRQSARQMLTMVLNILDVQKFEDTAVVLDTRPQRLAELAATAVEQVRFLAERKNLTLELTVPESLRVQGDGEMLQRVLVNLLTNAVKYTPANGRIAIGAQAEGDGQVRVAVEDSGEGIPADQLEAVFARFGQHRARDSGQVRSTGLGLNFCKLAVEAHGGRIGVQSVPGRGSTFWFTLPRIDGSGADLQPTPTQRASHTDLSAPALDAADRELLAAIVAELRPIPIYRYSDLRRILDRADFPANAHIDAWRARVLTAIETENEALLAALLNN